MTRVVVAGALANKPGNAGEAWVRTNWVRGLLRLGLDVRFVEVLSPTAWGAAAPGCIEWSAGMLERFDLVERSVLLDGDADGPALLAGDRRTFADVLAGADLLVNISGHLGAGPLLDACARRAYVDLDPGYTQIWHAQGADVGVSLHDVHFSVGLNLGGAGCTIPLNGTRWLPVLPPVLLDEWTPAPGTELDRFTTVASWRGGYGVLEHDGTRYGSKAHQFRALASLPTLVGVPLEIALDIHPDDGADQRLLVEGGWRLVDPQAAAGDPDRYRDYLRGSGAELSVAQGAYVATRSGWFSDRTAHYLAAGRPALVQDTGSPLPPHAGVLGFSSMGDAARRAAQLGATYEGRRAAARSWAEQHLDAGVVLARLLEQAGIA